MSNRERIRNAFSQLNAPADTLERVYETMERNTNTKANEAGRRLGRGAIRFAIAAALILALGTVGTFAAKQFRVSRNLLVGNETTQSGNEAVLPDDPNGGTLNGFRITAPFSERTLIDGTTYHHNGIDIQADKGTPVLAAADGTVRETGYKSANGNYVVIDHAEGYATVYMHLDEISVNAEQTVAAGDPIGTVGQTGMVTGPCLHFEIRKGDEPLDPMAYFGEEE